MSVSVMRVISGKNYILSYYINNSQQVDIDLMYNLSNIKNIFKGEKEKNLSFCLWI